MMFGVDYNKIIAWMMPKAWRKPVHAAWLQALIAPVKRLHTQLLTFIVMVAFEMKVTGQVCILRWALNEKFDTVLRRIILRDAVTTGQVYTFLEVENKPVYMPFYIGGGGDGFEVIVPVALMPLDILIRARLNKNKLPGTRYKIIYV